MNFITKSFFKLILRPKELFKLSIMCWYVLGKTSGEDELTLEEVHEILNREWSVESLKALEIRVVQLLESSLYSVSYADCLEFIFYDNCLWHPKFYPLISLAQSVLLR